MLQEHNSDISCYKFIFNQNINCQMSQKNFLLLMLRCTIIFVTIQGSIEGGSWYFRPSPRGGSGDFIPIAREGHIIFNAQFIISTPPSPTPYPLLISDESLMSHLFSSWRFVASVLHEIQNARLFLCFKFQVQKNIGDFCDCRGQQHRFPRLVNNVVLSVSPRMTKTKCYCSSKAAVDNFH